MFHFSFMLHIYTVLLIIGHNIDITKHSIKAIGLYSVALIEKLKIALMKFGKFKSFEGQNFCG